MKTIRSASLCPGRNLPQRSARNVAAIFIRQKQPFLINRVFPSDYDYNVSLIMMRFSIFNSDTDLQSDNFLHPPEGTTPMNTIPNSTEKIQLGVLGEHLPHTLSPEIHFDLLKQQHISADFKVYEMSKTEVHHVLDVMREKNIIGMNVTISSCQSLQYHNRGKKQKGTLPSPGNVPLYFYLQFQGYPGRGCDHQYHSYRDVPKCRGKRSRCFCRINIAVTNVF